MFRSSSTAIALINENLVAQRVTDRQDQVASKVVSWLAAGIFNSVITSVVSKLPVFEFSIFILNDVQGDLPAEKIEQCLRLGCTTGKNHESTVVLDGTRANRFSNAIACSRQGQFLRTYLSVTWYDQKDETDGYGQFIHAGFHRRLPRAQIQLISLNCRAAENFMESARLAGPLLQFGSAPVRPR